MIVKDRSKTNLFLRAVAPNHNFRRNMCSKESNWAKNFGSTLPNSYRFLYKAGS